MRTTIRTIASLLALVIPMQRAQAQLLTSSFGGIEATAFRCGERLAYERCLFEGPVQVGTNGFEVLYFSGSTIASPSPFVGMGNGVSMLNANGWWDGTASAYAEPTGQNPESVGLFFRFSAPVYQVGAWMNYAYQDSPMWIRAYGKNGELLSEFLMQDAAPINTPNGYNESQFRGLESSTGIWTFELWGAGVVTRDLFVGEVTPPPNGLSGDDANGPNTPQVLILEQTPTVVTPEPGTYVLVAAGLAGLGFLKRRRRA